MTATITKRQRLTNEIEIILGGSIVDVELDPSDYDMAITLAVDRYRQRSGNSIEEAFVFLDVQPDVATYTLPGEIQEVRSVYRNVLGNSGGAAIDPFHSHLPIISI